jgi:HPt (histidine-containing phosphotransfer) domain-containing protein
MSQTVDRNNFKSDKINDTSDNDHYPPPDLTYLNELAQGDEAFVKEMLTYFVEKSPELLISMKGYALTGDHDRLKFLVHSLLPQLSIVGILAAIPDMEKIESESKLMEDLNVVIERAITTIKYGIEDLKKKI